MDQQSNINTEDQDRNPFDVLADQFTEQCRAGQHPSVEDYAAGHPELADKIRELFPAIEAIEQLGSRSASEKRFVKANAIFDRNKIEQIGDYRIVREIGRGGMGVVYEAIQQSLGRHVAIKLLMQTSTSPLHVQRFEREARIAANLHHTNIVQVFGVGTQDGFHYYVMQLIDGHGLDQVIEDLRQSTSDEKSLTAEALFVADYKSVAKLGRSVAEALQHAHDQGTLHRDIKPANLMLDAEGGIRVTDFGLAKAMDDNNVSRTGDVVGTLRFMAPEQFAGNPDPRSDVYSLGLTIYELLTLKPAWDESSRSHLIAGTESRTQARIVSPAVHDPNIPRDLETIVLKACAHDPTDRYQTAQALADDLENYLEGRPINARPPYSFEVFAKWCRRNPAIATLSGIAALLLTLATVSTSIGYLWTNAALTREQQQRTRAVAAREMAEQQQQQAEQQRVRAEKTLGISLQALDRVYNRFVPERIPQGTATLEGVDGEQLVVSSQAMLSKETAALLEDILGFYDQFAKQDSENLLLKQQAAKANRRVGDIHCQLGDYEKSIEAYDKAVKLFEKIGGNDLEIARIESRLGNVFRETGEEDFATASFYHARRLLEGIHQANPDSAEAKHELARTLYLISRHRPPSPEQQRPPPRGHSAGLNRAIDLLTGLQAKQPNNPDHSFLLALCYRERDGGRGMLNQQTLELLEGLCQQHPEVPEYQFELAETLCRVGVHHLSGSQAKESVRQLERSLKWLDTLVNDHPNIPEYRKTKAHAHHRLGTLWRHSDFEIDSAEPTDAIKQAFSNLRLAVEAQAEIHKQFPESPAELLWLARMRESLARCLLQDDQPEQALELVEESIANLGQLTVGGNFDAAMLHSNIFQHHTRAEILDALGRDEEAAKSWKTLDEFRKKLRAID